MESKPVISLDEPSTFELIKLKVMKQKLAELTPDLI